MVSLFPSKTTIPSSRMPSEDAKENDVGALPDLVARGYHFIVKLNTTWETSLLPLYYMP
jgi:hypothetical protein